MTAQQKATTVSQLLTPTPSLLSPHPAVGLTQQKAAFAAHLTPRPNPPEDQVKMRARARDTPAAQRWRQDHPFCKQPVLPKVADTRLHCLLQTKPGEDNMKLHANNLTTHLLLKELFSAIRCREQ